MGFNIQDFIQRVERFVQDLPEKSGESKADGNLDAFEKASLFNNPKLAGLKAELKAAVAAGDVAEADMTAVNEILGFEKTDKAAPRKAGEKDGKEKEEESHPMINITVQPGGMLIINVENKIELKLTLNITADLKSLVNDIVNAFRNDIGLLMNQNTDISNKLFAYLDKKDKTDEEYKSAVFSLLTQIYNEIKNSKDLEVDALFKIIDAIEQAGIKIEGKLDMIQTALLSKLDNVLSMLEINNDDQKKLLQLVEENNKTEEEQNNTLQLILDAIKKLNNGVLAGFNDSKEQIQALFDLIKTNGDNEQDAYKQMIALLNLINKDTSENKETTKLILDAVKEGNQALVDALTTLNTNFTKYGDDIVAKLADVIKHIDDKEITVNVELDDLLAKLDDILSKLGEIKDDTGNISTNSNTIVANQERVIDLITQYGDDFATKFGDILTKLGEIKDDTGNISTNSNTIVANQERVIDLITQYGDDFATTLDEMLTHLSNIKTNTDTLVANQAQILDLIQQYGEDFASKFDQIIQKFDGQSEKFDKFLEYMETMDANLATITTNTNTLVEQGVADKAVQDEINTFVQNIYEKMSDMVINVDANVDLTPVIQAINAVQSQVYTSIQGLQDYIGENITGEVSNINSTLTRLTNNFNAFTGKIFGINEDNQKTYEGKTITELLQEISDKIGSGDPNSTNIGDSFVTLFNILGFKAEAGDDPDTLKDILLEILAAIRDHKVEVVVKYETSGTSTPNEGETKPPEVSVNPCVNEGEINSLIDEAGVKRYSRALAIGHQNTDAVENIATQTTQGKGYGRYPDGYKGVVDGFNGICVVRNGHVYTIDGKQLR